MTRTSFLKSLIALAAVPSVIPEIAVTVAKYKQPIPQWKSVWFCIHQHQFADYEHWNYLLYDKDNSPLIKRCQQEGIDLDKEYTMKTGYNNDDFARGLVTLVIKQKI